MSQQGKRQARFRQWAGGTALSYNGDLIAAAQVTSGLSGLSCDGFEQHIHRAITGSTSTNLRDLQAQTAAYLGVPGGWDSVGDELPLQAFDFTSGGTFPGLNYGTSVAGAVSRDSLIYRPAGEARTSSFGLLVERQATNKCTNTNLKPTDTSGTNPQANWTEHKRVARDGIASISQEAADALDQLDPQGNVTAIYQSISNATGGAIAFAGTVGNTNPHTNSYWQFVLSGNVGPSASGQLGPFYGPEGWQRKEFSFTPLAGTDLASLSAQGAAEVLWFGNQLEETTTTDPGRSSLIEISGATATRLGDNVSVNTPAFDVSSFTVVVAFNFYKDTPLNFLSRTASLDTTGAEQFYGVVRHTTQAHQLRNEGLLVVNSGVTYSAGSDAAQAFGMDGSGNAAIAVDGGNYTSLAFTPATGYPFLRFAARSDGAQQSNGYVKTASLWDLPATQANLERLSG